ncbi:MAG TPA: polyamine ABC transporter substrate-binding protein [Methylocella sp.]|jgi:putrescine transport system substrate-binding protein|nr:polyamine ABC transporter substrate-binding protein [Methylocella sp.]
MKNSLAALWLFGLCLCGQLLPAFGQEKTVSVYGWGDYIDPKVIEDFTKETGIKVTYDAYDSNEAFEARFLSGKAGFDVVVVPGPVLQRQIAVGLYQKLDKTKLPNSKNLWPEVMARLGVYDPGSQYAVNYMWFTAGIAYNVEKANELLGDAAADASLNSWDILFKRGNLKKFAGCGITVLDSGEDLFAIALNYLKADPASMRPSELKRAGELLSGMRRDVKKFDSADFADALANGDICLGVGYSGDSFRARDRAREADNGIEINYTIPKEGTLISLDNLAIPKDAPHVEEAYAFIDFLLRPAIAARNTNFTHLANGVLASKSSIGKDIVENKAIYPDAAMLQRLFAVPNHDPAARKTIVREWARIKTGK